MLEGSQFVVLYYGTPKTVKYLLKICVKVKLNIISVIKLLYISVYMGGILLRTFKMHVLFIVEENVIFLSKNWHKCKISVLHTQHLPECFEQKSTLHTFCGLILKS